MTMAGMYVSPEQLMQDRADYARKGIARGRSLAAVEYQGGVALVAENASSSLRKVSEIYDRIAFGGVGRYNEFDQLRIAGVRYAELKGYQYSREDVDARSLANQYAQMLGQIFTHEMKPMEVEIVVAEIDHEGDAELYRIQYDGTVADEQHWCCIGGDSEAVLGRLSDGVLQSNRLLDQTVPCWRKILKLRHWKAATVAAVSSASTTTKHRLSWLGNAN